MESRVSIGWRGGVSIGWRGASPLDGEVWSPLDGGLQVDCRAISVVSSTGENAIPASPNARDEFHEVVVLRPDEFVKKFFSLYCHSKAPFE